MLGVTTLFHNTNYCEEDKFNLRTRITSLLAFGVAVQLSISYDGNATICRSGCVPGGVLKPQFGTDAAV
jgi:hypothetical protein